VEFIGLEMDIVFLIFFLVICLGFIEGAFGYGEKQ